MTEKWERYSKAVMARLEGKEVTRSGIYFSQYRDNDGRIVVLEKYLNVIEAAWDETTNTGYVRDKQYKRRTAWDNRVDVLFTKGN